MSRTTTPCPGCGDVDSGRPANKVCSGCTRLLAEARAVLEAADAERRNGYELYRHDGHPGFYGKEAYRALPYHPTRHSQALRVALDDLVDVVADQQTIPVVGEWGHQLGEDHNNHGDPILYVRPDGRHKGGDGQPWRRRARLHPEQAIAINRLDDEIRIAITMAYRAGLSEGRDFLRQTVEGKISIRDFNELNAAQEESE